MAASPGLRSATVAAAALATLLAAALVWTDAWPQVRGPAPWPPEWQWLRRTEPTSRDAGPALLGAALLLGLLALPDTLVRRRAVLVAGFVAGVTFWLGLAALEPRGAWRTLSRNTLDSSYHRVAVATSGEDLRTFLATHAARLPGWTGRDRHAATHPPGAVLFHRLALRAASLDGVRVTLLRLRGADPGADASHAAALLAPLLLAALAAATCWPLAALARACGETAETAARLGLTWLLLPGPAVLVGQVDAALALPVTTCAALLVLGLKRGSIPLGMLAGLAAGVALLVSYGAAAFAAVVTGVAVVVVRPAPGVAARVLAAAGVSGLAVVAAPALAGHDVAGAAATALRIHRDEYTRARSYALWLPFNVLDVVLFAGAPLAVLAAERVRASAFARAVLVGMGVLWLSGTVRGEAGRIWAPLFPLLVAAALVAREPLPRTAWVGLGAALAALAFVVRASWHVF